MKNFDKRTVDHIVVYREVDPGVTDDIVHGYDTKQFWVNTLSDTLFMCKSSAVGAANWASVSGSGGGGGLSPIPASRILGNATGSTAVPTALTAAQVKTLLAISTSDVSGLGTAATLAFDTDAALGANSDARLATQKAVKAYVDGLVTGALQLQGNTDCSGNPNYPSAAKGDAYVVTVAGKIGGASGKSVDIGDMYVASVDNAGGNEAGVGADWFVLEHNLVGAVLTVNGHGGPTVTLTAADVDAKLGAIVALTWTSDAIPYFTGAGTLSSFASTSYGRGLVALSDRDALYAAVTPTLKKVVLLTDTVPVALDLSLGDYFQWTITGDHILANIVSGLPASGYRKVFTVEVIQGSGGSHVPSFDTNFKLNTTIASIPWSTTAGAKDIVVFVIDSSGIVNITGYVIGAT